MNRQVYTIAGVLTALVIMVFLGLAYHYRDVDLKHTRAELAELQSALMTNRLQLTNLQAVLTENLERVAKLEQERAAATKAQKSIEEEMRAALDSKEVTISELQGQLKVNIIDRVLFDSGEAVLKAEGETILQKVAKVLAQHTNRLVHVAGHTDNVPIRPAAWNRFPTNWELSTARATAAVRFLTEKAGISPTRVGAVGYGEFHPVASNSTAEGRAKNRRIEIVVLPESIVPKQLLTPPTTSPGHPAGTATTNAPTPPTTAPTNAVPVPPGPASE